MESWVGGTNSIDSSTMEGQGEKEVRDSWDRELDRGKVSRAAWMRVSGEGGFLVSLGEEGEEESKK